MVETIRLNEDDVAILDQRALPANTQYIRTADYRVVGDAIRTLAVRGAPAIGVAAAFGIVLAAREAVTTGTSVRDFVREAAAELQTTRPTAVNLFWALDRMLEVISNDDARDHELVRDLTAEAREIYDQDLAANRKMGMYGAVLVPQKARVLTHCNAGALATAGYGTALGVIRAAHEQGKVNVVYAGETRPLLQGARLTAWELARDGIDVVLITDSMAATVMARRLVDMVIVGADRIARNGDTANKIGTYALAVLARAHGIPLYVAAPLSTIDLSVKSGDDIPIEERDGTEVTTFAGRQVAPPAIGVFNPAFDVTPAGLISAIITEEGIVRDPYSEGLAAIVERALRQRVSGRSD